MKGFIWLFLFITCYSNAQEIVEVDLSNPHATIYTHFYFLQNDSYQPKKAAATILGLSESKAIEKVLKIKKVLDGKGLSVDFNKIPSNPNYKDSIGYTTFHKYILFPERMPKIYVEKIDNKWYYSSETVASIDQIYKEVFPWYVDKLQNLIPASGHKRFLGIELWQVLGVVLLLVLVVFIFILIKKISFFILRKIQHQITH